MKKFKERLIDYIYSRNGMDGLTQFVVYLALVILVVSAVFDVKVLYFSGIGLVIYMYFRFFSPADGRRARENAVFMKGLNRLVLQFFKAYNRAREERIYKFTRCPNCGFKAKIRRGRGLQKIHCEKCRIYYEMKA